jgi:outer membrane protein TolC
MDQAVQMALDNNPSVQLAKLKLANAITQIDLTRSSGYPQIAADISDTLSSERGYSSNGSASSSGVSLPNGGSIPVVVDQGGTSTGTSGFSSSSSGGTSIGTYTPPTSATVVPSVASTTVASSATTASSQPAAASSVSAADVPAVLAAYNAALEKQATSVATSHATQTSGGQYVQGGNYNNYGGRITISQGIDIFGLVPAALDVSNLTRDFYLIDLRRVSNEVALTAKTDYINVVSAQSALATQQEQVDAASINLRVAQDKFNAGTAAQYDVLTAQTTLSNAQQLLASDQNQLDLSVANLINVLGKDQKDTVTVVPPPMPPLDLKLNLDDLTSTAYIKRPELQQARSNVIIAKKLVTLNAAALYPALSLDGTGNFAGAAVPGSPQNTYSVVANLSIPLYDGGATHARVKSAQITVQTQRVTEDQLKQNVALEVREAYLSVLNGQTRSSSAVEGTTSAEEALRIANIRYKNGLGTLLDVTNAEAQLATAKNNLTSAQQAYLTSLAQLTRAEGGR